jgi:putative flippase GtrA
MNIIDQLFGNETGNLIQFVKYAISGGIATITHIFVFHLVAWKLFYALQANDWFVRIMKLRVHQINHSARARNAIKANTVTFIASNFVAYLINIYWVFVPGRHHWVVQLSLFYVVSGVALAAGTAVMVFLIRRFGMLTSHAFGASIFAGVMINYAMRKFFIFAG